MQFDAITTKIREFIMGHFPPLARKVSNEDRLLGNGVLDSLGVLEVVTFVEKEFQITVGDDELLPENFNSISCMAVFVQRKLGAAPSAQ